MFCSTSVTEHLMRGAVAFMAIALAIYALPLVWPLLILVPIALILMRGCPMCWMMGLFEVIHTKSRAGKH